MLRSMYSGISGMKSNQVKLDVIGNNISNLGTTGFKASTVKFQDMLSQNIGDATAASANQGGVNSRQVGLGVQLSSIDTVMTQGMLQPTGRNLDLALDGGGFFMVSKGPAVYGDNTLQVSHKVGAHNISDQSIANSGSEVMYTRAGTFTLDEQGNLLTSDGYRVMGYSVTNDDNGVQPTGKNPNSLSLRGLDFRFGPGSQLNDYKVVIGSVGPGTVTDAEIDKSNKIIKIHGDFSQTSTMTTEAIESSINKSLSTAGISQRINVSGKVVPLGTLGSNAVEGGSDATPPSSVSLMGVTFKFGDGGALNGYTVKVGDISESSTNAKVDSSSKTITINADFMNAGSVTGEEIANAINTALKAQGIKQEVSAIGNPSAIPGLEATTKGGTKGKAPDVYKDTSNGFEIKFNMIKDSEGKFSELNNYEVAIGKSGTAFSIDKSSKVIKIAEDELDSINAKLQSKGIKSTQIEWPTDMSALKDGYTFKIRGNGEDIKAPDKINIGGFTINLPKGEDFNDITFKISDIEKNGEPTVGYDAKNKTVTIEGNFMNSNPVSANVLEDKLKETLEAAGLEVDDVSISGNAKIDLESESDLIDGGTELEAPKEQKFFGMGVKFNPGGSLNGYKLVVGDTSPNTKTSAGVDTKNKTITVNGDFVNGRVTAANIQSAINRALKDKGIDQGVEMSGKPDSVNETVSEITSGGTPVQSLDGNGVISFVDGSKEVKAYDEGLKTLKIPNKVKDPATGEELSVKSFSIDKSGVINCILENGSVAAVGQLAMADFKNPEGLDKIGGNLYTKSANSGEAIIKSGVGTKGDDNSKGYADMLQGMIEMSNVDLSEQFTDMITTTRAFQASGKIINTGDEILQDIINLKR